MGLIKPPLQGATEVENGVLYDAFNATFESITGYSSRITFSCAIPSGANIPPNAEFYFMPLGSAFMNEIEGTMGTIDLNLPTTKDGFKCTQAMGGMLRIEFSTDNTIGFANDTSVFGIVFVVKGVI